MDIRTKDELLEQISLAVEQIQKKFIQGNDVIRDGQETYFLCKCVDEILHHGLKEGLISWATEPSLWTLLEKITCAEDIEEINMLHLKTDKEKCSAWIRMAVNVNLLGSYISTLHQDKSLLSNHYYDYAFLRDPVSAETVKSLLNYGIANFDFLISVDLKQIPKLSNEETKQEKGIHCNCHGETKTNGDELSAARNNESFNKKKRKKKRSVIQRVVITDTPPHPDTESLINGDNVRDSLTSSGNDFRETNDCNDTTDGSDRSSKQSDADSVQCCNSENSRCISNELTVSENSDLEPLASSEKSLEYRVPAANGGVPEFSDNQRTCDDQGGGRTVGQTGYIGELHEQKGIVFGTCKIEQYTMAQSSANDARRHDMEQTRNGESVGRCVETKGQMDPNSFTTRNEFSAIDFHLEDSVGDLQGDLTRSKSDSVSSTSETSEVNPTTDISEVCSTTDISEVCSTTDISDVCSTTDTSEVYVTTDNAEVFPTTDTSEMYVTTDNSEVCSTIDTSEVCPTIDTSEVYVTTDNSEVCPTTDNSEMCPTTDNSEVCPTTDNSEMCPTTDTSEMCPTTDNSEVYVTAKTLRLHTALETSEIHPSPKTACSDSETSEPKNDVAATSKSQNSRNFEKLEKSASFEDSGSGRYSSAQEDVGSPADSKDFPETADDLSETADDFSETGEHNYRVRKVENAEFVSSSYGSSYSDVTDTSYDERDLNFIPGIHNYKKYDRKSALDSLSSVNESGSLTFDTSHYTDSLSSRPSSLDDASGRFSEFANEWEMFDDLLNVEEEHFSGPDNFVGLTTSEELEIAIDHYKKMIKAKLAKSVDRDVLVKKLIELRLRLQKERDGPPVVNPKFRKIVSHHFRKEIEATGSKHSCDHCGNMIWIMWQSLFTCNDCGYHSHRKCLEHIQRPCPVRNLSSLSYILDICPDTGLDAQQYRCAECRKTIAISKDGVAEARLCDYTGQYFCDHCHWNDHVFIPARVLRNWDFSQYKVCRQTKQRLDLMKTKPLLNLKQMNPMLFRYVEELREVGKLREDILVMKNYFLTCREALDSKLLIQLQKRQHFVDNCHTYSFQDLLDLNSDVLVPEISKVHALFLAHIKFDCELCRARGFICEVCQDTSDVIFAFDPHAVKCMKCRAVFHKNCFKREECPKCYRKRKVVEASDISRSSVEKDQDKYNGNN